MPTFWWYLLLPRDSASFATASVARLHLQHGAEQLLRRLAQEADLGVGVQAVQVGGLGGEAVVDVLDREDKMAVVDLL